MRSCQLVKAATLAAAAVLSGSAAALTFDCERIVVDGIEFNLGKLGGPKQVHNIEQEWPTLSNHTFSLDICKNLPHKEKTKDKLNCPSGTRICYTKYDYNTEDGTHLVEKVYPIAGTFDASHGRSLEPDITRLKGSKSHEDSTREGLRVELNGGYSSESKDTSRKQQAIIEFECDHDRTGLEEVEELDGDAPKRAQAKALSRRDEDDKADKDKNKDDKDGKDDKGDNDDKNDKASLQFVSYKEEHDKRDVLRLKWRTKYACEKRSDSGDGDHDSPSSHWGFFTWMFIILFLGVAAYLIFGSWLNYSQYGARGWDLLPHGDTLRDIPYAVKEYIRSVIGAIQGNGSRGGYSAV